MITGPISTGARSSEGRGQQLFSRENLLPFFLVTGLFFLWGIPNNLNDVLIRQFMKSFEINRLQAGLVQFAFYLGYFFLSSPAALLMRRYGYKTGLVSGLFLYSFGTFLFWPAAMVQSYWFFLVALFVIASGLAFLETGAGAFITELGDPASSERRLNFTQAFNPLGSICGVLAGTTFIFSGIELSASQVSRMKAAGEYNAYLQHETTRVITPYLVLGCIVVIWAFLIIRTKFPRVGQEEAAELQVRQGSYRNLLAYPHFIAAVIAQFFYVGAQIGTWSYFIQYVQDYVHQPEKIAGYFLSGTLVAFAAGRFSATYFMQFIRPNLLMGIYSVANVGLVAMAILFPGWLGVWAVFLTSFFMSLMYPTIFALALKGLGPNTKLLVMSIIGGAVITLVIGLVAQSTGSMARAMIVPLVCYGIVTYFAFIGSRIRVA